jgi:hypothetical protein
LQEITMTNRMTPWLLLTVAVLLGLLVLAQFGLIQSVRAAQPQTQVHDVLRARVIELVSEQGQVVGQLHTAPDGSGNLRLRSGSGEVRVKLGATADGSGLLLMNQHTEPAVSLTAASTGAALALEERGKPRRLLTP